MKRFGEADDPRRRLLVQALTAGVFATGLPGAGALAQGFFGSRPTRLPANQSIYRITGQATVNERDATLETRINPGDRVQTGANSEIVFVVNNHAMILRDNSNLVIEAEKSTATSAAAELVITGLRILTGKLLSVSRKSPMQVGTLVATIGIRGTGFYVESDPEQTYFCTCYGVADIASNTDPDSRETVTAKHHDRPVYIVGNETAGRNIRNAPFINHTDQELSLIETLVGRTPPFVFPTDTYRAPRREY